jgi:hypothetical protein
MLAGVSEMNRKIKIEPRHVTSVCLNVISRGEAFIVGIGEVISFFSFNPEI